MPTPLILDYTTSATIYIPNAIARKLKKHDGRRQGKPWSYYVKYNELRYWDEEGVMKTIEATQPDSDYKYPEAETWDDAESESGDESSDEESDESSDEEDECEFCGEEDKDGHECIPERRERDAPEPKPDSPFFAVDDQSHPIDSPFFELGRSLASAETVKVPIKPEPREEPAVCLPHWEAGADACSCPLAYKEA